MNIRSKLEEGLSKAAEQTAVTPVATPIKQEAQKKPAPSPTPYRKKRLEWDIDEGLKLNPDPAKVKKNINRGGKLTIPEEYYARKYLRKSDKRQQLNKILK